MAATGCCPERNQAGKLISQLSSSIRRIASKRISERLTRADVDFFLSLRKSSRFPNSLVTRRRNTPTIDGSPESGMCKKEEPASSGTGGRGCPGSGFLVVRAFLCRGQGGIPVNRRLLSEANA